MKDIRSTFTLLPVAGKGKSEQYKQLCGVVVGCCFCAGGLLFWTLWWCFFVVVFFVAVFLWCKMQENMQTGVFKTSVVSRPIIFTENPKCSFRASLPTALTKKLPK